MAAEIIFQCGDKLFWEEHGDSKERMYYVYRMYFPDCRSTYRISKLQML